MRSVAAVSFVLLALVATGCEATQEAACLDARTGTTPFDRRDAVRRLAAMRTRSPRVVQQLETSMLDPDQRVRLAAAVALGRTGSAFLPTDQPWLLEILAEFDVGSRIEAARVLSVIGSRDAIVQIAAARAEGGPAAEELRNALEAIVLREHIERGGLELADGAREVGQVSVSPPKGALSEKD